MKRYTNGTKNVTNWEIRMTFRQLCLLGRYHFAPKWRGCTNSIVV